MTEQRVGLYHGIATYVGPMVRRWVSIPEEVEMHPETACLTGCS